MTRSSLAIRVARASDGGPFGTAGGTAITPGVPHSAVDAFVAANLGLDMVSLRVDFGVRLHRPTPPHVCRRQRLRRSRTAMLCA
jgi:hypothetical protein